MCNYIWPRASGSCGGRVPGSTITLQFREFERWARWPASIRNLTIS